MLAWIDHWTILLVAGLALLFYGSRLPEVARSLGRSLSEFKRGMREVQDEVSRDELDADAPRKRLRPPAERDPDEPDGARTKAPADRQNDRERE